MFRIPRAVVALTLLLALGSAQAAVRSASVSRAEFDALQSQLQALVQRLDQLETRNAMLYEQNAALQGQNARLEALAAQRAAETKRAEQQAGAATGVPGAAAAGAGASATNPSEWASRIKGRGDLRYRHERISGERAVDGSAEDASDRDRERIRARLGFDATVTDTVKATLLLSTGGEDPRGTNQTLGGSSGRKSVGLDLAFADWRFMPGGNLVLGKQPYPVWRPVNSLFLDPDVNPEGVAVRLARDPWFANAYGFWVSEQYDADPDVDNSDAQIVGLQGGAKFEIAGGQATLAANYYECLACRNHSPLYANNGNGNTTYLVGSVNYLLYGYDILDLSAQFGTKLFGLPLNLTAGYARNLASGVEYDTAWALGGLVGRASEAHTWEAGVLYQSIAKDALFGQVVDSDFGGGFTDSAGWVFKGSYAPVRNVTLNAAYYLNTLNKDLGPELDYDRLQLDVNYRF